MLWPRSILLATDFQPASDNATRMAARLTKALNIPTTAINVVESSLPPIISRIRQAEAASMLDDLRNKFSQLEAPLAECFVPVGPIADTIVQTATEIKADLVVLGAGIIAEKRTFVAGPMAQAVMEQAPQQVLLAHPRSLDGEIRTILCPVDHSTTSLKGLRNAIGLAQAIDARLLVLSVIPEVNWLTAAAETGNIVDAKAEYEHKWCEELNAFLASVSLEGVRHTKLLSSGVPHERIVAVANEHDADLIVMGATGRTGLLRVLLGSTTRRVLRDLPRSLLTVKQEDVEEALLEDDLRNAALLFAEGRALYQARAHEPAAAKLRQSLARNPFHLRSLELLADTLSEVGKDQEADRYRRRAAQVRNQV